MVTEQINLRLPPKFLADVKYTASKRGYRNVQAFIEEAVRRAVYDNIVLTAQGKRKIAQALSDMQHGRTVDGDATMAKMRRLASEKR